MNIDIITNKIIYGVSEKIKEAETFFSEIAKRIQEIFNKFRSSKTEEFVRLETLLLNSKLSIADVFAINEESFNEFLTKDRSSIYENLEKLKNCKPDELNEITKILTTKATERTSERTLILNLLSQINKIQTIFHEANTKYDLELDEIGARKEINATNILLDLTLELPLEIAFDVTENFVKENGETGLLKLLEKFEWLANETSEKLDQLEGAISKYAAQNEFDKELQIILLTQIDWARVKKENSFI